MKTLFIIYFLFVCILLSAKNDQKAINLKLDSLAVEQVNNLLNVGSIESISNNMRVINELKKRGFKPSLNSQNVITMVKNDVCIQWHCEEVNTTQYGKVYTTIFTIIKR